MMKAVICTKYGEPEVLKIKEIEKPQPKEKEILIKVKTSSITTAETMMRKGTPKFARLFLGFNKPKAKVTGTGYAGIVESIGSKVISFKKGDAVFGETALGFGTNAEYVCTSEESLILPKPDGLSYEQAACMCDGALTASNFLKVLAKVKPGQSILINGAAGSIGSIAVQIAKSINIYTTGVCSSNKTNFVLSLGAHKVIDYNKVDFTKGDTKYDVIFDTVGKSSYCDCRKILKKRGIFISPVLSIGLLFQVMFTNMFLSKKAKFSATGLKPVKELKPLLHELVNLVEIGIITPVIDRTFTMEQVVEAHRYVDNGHKKGNVVLLHS